MAEIVADLRDDLVAMLLGLPNRFETEMMSPRELAELQACEALKTIKRWCAKEPTNDN